MQISNIFELEINNKYINIIQNWYPIMYSNMIKSFNINLYSLPIFIICLMCN